MTSQLRPPGAAGSLRAPAGAEVGRARQAGRRERD